MPKNTKIMPLYKEGERGNLDRHWRTLFLDTLAETSNVSEAARRAGINPSRACKVRREESAFRAKWADALNEGYAHLELETLHRLGHVLECPDIDLLHTEQNWRYRNTAQFVFDRRDEAPIAGYFAPGSHDVVSIDDCLLQSSAAIRILNTVRHILPELGLQPFERKDGRGWLKHLIIRGACPHILGIGSATVPLSENW